MKKNILLMILVISFKSLGGTYDVTLTRYDSISDANEIAKKMAIYDQVCVPYPTLCLSSISDDSDGNLLIGKQNVSIADSGSILVSTDIIVTDIPIPRYAIDNKGYYLRQYSEMINNTFIINQSIVTKLRILEIISENSDIYK